jgi:2-polyprenyl-3-methyl-5-hydroxy-6-metoxy-1,4-benzoquinol methylase
MGVGRNSGGEMQEATNADEAMRQNRASWDERAVLHARDATGFYAVERFLAGEDILLPIESRELGEVAGKHLLHLQCHIGLDTLSLARRGAIVTGLDFSAAAIASARDLATRAGLDALFVEADVYLAPQRLIGGYDVVYVSWGSLNWLPDIDRWAATVAALLAPGGFLYLIEEHPSFATMIGLDGKLVTTLSWRTSFDRPDAFEPSTTYTGDDTPLACGRIYEWRHPLSEIIMALLRYGLELDFLHEHEALPWRRLPMMISDEDRMFRLPDRAPRAPLAFSLRAFKR